MSHFEWFDYMRMLTAFFSLWSVYLIGQRLNRNWTTYTRTLREQSWVLQALLILVMEASLETALTDAPFGPKTLISFMVSCAALRAQLRHQGYLKNEPPLK